MSGAGIKISRDRYGFISQLLRTSYHQREYSENILRVSNYDRHY